MITKDDIANERDESFHWLQKLMSVRKRDRPKVMAEITHRKYQWMLQCSKAQIPFAALKICIDNTLDGFLCPVTGSSDDCDFCVCGNTASAIAKLQTVLFEYDFVVNVDAWWRRYVRYASVKSVCIEMQQEDTTKNYTCYKLHKKPAFWQLQKHFADQSATTVLPRERRADSTVVSTRVKKKTVYRCQICHQPKKGHRCAGLPPPPVPDSPPTEKASGLTQPPPLPIDLNVTGQKFEELFSEVPTCDTETEEQESHAIKMSRIERLYGKKIACETSTRPALRINVPQSAEVGKSFKNVKSLNGPTETTTDRTDHAYDTKIDLLM